MSSLHQVFEPLCHPKPLLICFLQATNTGGFFLDFTSFPSILAFSELDTEDMSILHMVHLNLCLLFRCMTSASLAESAPCEHLEKENVKSIFIPSPLEQEELKDEPQKTQLMSKTYYTNCMQVWLGLCGWCQREPRVSKYTHNTYLTHQSQGKGTILIEQVSVISKILFFCVHVSMKKCVPWLTFFHL